MSSVFDKHYKQYDEWYEKHKFEYLSELEALQKVLPKDGKGLEIGVGTGRFAVPLGIHFGIDPSEKMLEIAEKRGINTQKGVGENLPFDNTSFDYVAIIITICFAKNPRKVLKETARVLKNNGRIIVGIVDKNSILGQFYQTKKSVFYEHAKFFTVEELTDLLLSAGFENISYCQTLFELPENTKSVQSVEEGYGKGGFVVVAATVKKASQED